MKRITKILIAVVVLLMIARLLLPYFVLRYINKTLADMGDYTGHVEDIDIQLIRGLINSIISEFVKSTARLKSHLYSSPKPICRSSGSRCSKASW